MHVFDFVDLDNWPNYGKSEEVANTQTKFGDQVSSPR